jgi:hypothetical protein
MSIAFISLGGLMAIPSAVWYFMFSPQGLEKFFCTSFFLLGLGSVILGLSVGYIGREARRAELPPEPSGSATREAPPATNVAAAPAVVTPSPNVVQTG